MVDLIDEASDLETLKSVQEGREAVRMDAKGIPVERLFEKIRKKHK